MGKLPVLLRLLGNMMGILVDIGADALFAR